MSIHDDDEPSSSSSSSEGIVIDFGGATTKTGVSGDDKPSLIFPSVTFSSLDPFMDLQVGHDAYDAAARFPEPHPFRHLSRLFDNTEIIQSWELFDSISRFAVLNSGLARFSSRNNRKMKKMTVKQGETAIDAAAENENEELLDDVSNTNILATESVFGNRMMRDRMTEVMFENLQCATFYISIRNVLSLYSAGRTTGLCLDAGDTTTSVCPIYEGYSLPHAVLRSGDLSGRDATKKMLRILKQSPGFGAEKNALLARDPHRMAELCKERLCCVDPRGGEKNSGGAGGVVGGGGGGCGGGEETVAFELPDMSVLEIKESDRFAVGEVLINGGNESTMPVDEMILNSIRRCDTDVQTDLASNIIATGGCTFAPGYLERVSSSLNRRNEATAIPPCKLLAFPERAVSQWIGGSILSSLSSFQQMWITREEYDEAGPQIVHRKCF